MEEEIQVDCYQKENVIYKKAITLDGEYWDVRSIAKYLKLKYKTVYYHLRTKSEFFEPLRQYFKVKGLNPIHPSHTKRIMFLKVPDVFYRLLLYSKSIENKINFANSLFTKINSQENTLKEVINAYNEISGFIYEERQLADHYGSAWPSIRKTVLEKNNYQCVGCTEKIPALLRVHHLIPISKGGTNEIGNLIVVCFDCHCKLHPDNPHIW